MKILINLSAMLVAISCNSQVNNTRIIDKNNASAKIGDEGFFFNNSSLGIAGYEIPKGSGLTTIFLGSFWVGAEDQNGVLYLSGEHYSSNPVNQLHSGPIANSGQYTSLDYINQYQESIWKVTKLEINTHISNFANVGYSIPQSLLDWPGNGDVSLGVVGQLAPFVDNNGDGIYAPSDGDYPDIRGDEAVYVILNDQSGTNPNSLGIELHAMFYQFSSAGYFNNTTFLNVNVFNRSNRNYYNFKQTLYMDFDIGNYSDDYIGCNIANSVAFGYNGDENDEADGGRPGYGLNPPCQGIVSLSHDMHSFCYFTATSQLQYDIHNGSSAVIWNFMNAKWGDGSPWLYGGLGYQGSFGVSNSPTNFMYPGNPNDPAAWHEGNVNNPCGDRRGMFTISEARLSAGTSICSDYAFIYDKSSTRLANVQNVINIAGSLRSLYDSQFAFPCEVESFNAIIEEELLTFRLFPNPSTGTFSIHLEQPPTNGSVTIFDLTGREVFSQGIVEKTTEISLPEASGVYVVIFQSNQGSSVQKVIFE